MEFAELVGEAEKLGFSGWHVMAIFIPISVCSVATGSLTRCCGPEGEQSFRFVAAHVGNRPMTSQTATLNSAERKALSLNLKWGCCFRRLIGIPPPLQHSDRMQEVGYSWHHSCHLFSNTLRKFWMCFPAREVFSRSSSCSCPSFLWPSVFWAMVVVMARVIWPS